MIQQTIQKRRIRRASFLDSSLRLEGIKDIIQSSREQLYFSELKTKSKIKFKKSFLKYLNYCIEKEFVVKYKLPLKDIPLNCYSKRNPQPKILVFYKTTDKGLQFLEMVQ